MTAEDCLAKASKFILDSYNVSASINLEQRTGLGADPLVKHSPTAARRCRYLVCLGFGSYEGSLRNFEAFSFLSFLPVLAKSPRPENLLKKI